jgi:hypothetical protein
MGVGVADMELAVAAEVTLGEPDGHARRQAQQPRHDGVGRGELLAEAAPVLQELDDGVGAVVGRHVEVVGEHT